MRDTDVIEQIPNVIDYSERVAVEPGLGLRQRHYIPTLSAGTSTLYGNVVTPRETSLKDIRFGSRQAIEWSLTSYFTDPITLQLAFRVLVNTWERETGHFSIVQQKILHPAYQQIIGMGERVLPLLMNEIKHAPSHWFWALRSIAREDPAQNASTIEEATEAWIGWWNNKLAKRRYAVDFYR